MKRSWLRKANETVQRLKVLTMEVWQPEFHPQDTQCESREETPANFTSTLWHEYTHVHTHTHGHIQIIVSKAYFKMKRIQQQSSSLRIKSERSKQEWHALTEHTSPKDLFQFCSMAKATWGQLLRADGAKLTAKRWAKRKQNQSDLLRPFCKRASSTQGKAQMRSLFESSYSQL